MFQTFDPYVPGISTGNSVAYKASKKYSNEGNGLNLWVNFFSVSLQVFLRTNKIM